MNGINGVNTQGTRLGLNQAMDSYSKNIQSQIANKQKEMQELSKSEDMSLEDKMKKRQEIQQEIADLNNQLRQHQIEQRKEQQSKGSSMDDMLGGNRQAQKKSAKSGTGMSRASMQAIMSADASMGQVKVQSQVKTNLEGRTGVLETEIKYDTSGNTEAKEAELADIKEKVNNVTSSQMSALSDINKNLEEAAKADNEAGKTEDKKQHKEDDTTKVGENNRAESEENVAGKTVTSNSDTTVTSETESEEDANQTTVTHVDIKL
jgi:hypothetical protein